MVLSVIKDNKDKSMLRFIDTGPIYVSSDGETGINDAVKYFPYDFSAMEGEVKIWLDNLADHNKFKDGEEYGFGEDYEEMMDENDTVERASANIG